MRDFVPVRTNWGILPADGDAVAISLLGGSSPRQVLTGTTSRIFLNSKVQGLPLLKPTEGFHVKYSVFFCLTGFDSADTLIMVRFLGLMAVLCSIR